MLVHRKKTPLILVRMIVMRTHSILNNVILLIFMLFFLNYLFSLYKLFFFIIITYLSDLYISILHNANNEIKYIFAFKPMLFLNQMTTNWKHHYH